MEEGREERRARRGASVGRVVGTGPADPAAAGPII